MLVWLNRIWIQVTADRRRFGILCAAVGLGLLLWARLIIVSNVPRTAIAAPPPDQKNEVPVNKNSGGAAGGSALALPVAIELDTAPQRDPFVISPVYFPKPASPVEPPKVAQQVDKSAPKTVEDPFQVEARMVAKLRALVDRLKLEAAMGRDMAVISGKTYRTNEWIGGQQTEDVFFKLAEVRQRSVVLECDGRQFELQMSPPGN